MLQKVSEQVKQPMDDSARELCDSVRVGKNTKNVGWNEVVQIQLKESSYMKGGTVC